MHNALVHHSLTDVQPVPLIFYIKHDVLWHGVSLWATQVSCPVRVSSQFLVALQPLTTRA